jgi:hypothetical protein
MGASQRRKGAAYEREIVAQLRAAGYADAARALGQSRDGGGDIVFPDLVVECKRRRALVTLMRWMEQAQRAANASQMPIVVCRDDGHESLAILRWVDFLALHAPKRRSDIGGARE